MKKTGGWLVRYALEQLGVRFTFGIPGVHNTEMYDELHSSESIQPVLVTHEGCGAFMADAVSRTTGGVGTLAIVPAAGASHAASGIGEAFLDGIPLLVISGGIRSDSQFQYQLHDMDQHAMLRPITKRTFKVETHRDIVPTLFEAYRIATSGEPGPVFVEVPVNLQLDPGDVDELPTYEPEPSKERPGLEAEVKRAADLLSRAERPGLFVGWGAVDATDETAKIADKLGAPVATTLQGLSAFPANHPLHTGMSFGPAAVPAATEAFGQCDCLLAVGTRFAEIATGSFGVTVPKNLIHVDINPRVFNANYPAEVAIEGDAKQVLRLLADALPDRSGEKTAEEMKARIARNKKAYRQEWAAHDSKGRVNPGLFFDALRQRLEDDAIVVADDGNHTFLVAELMPILGPRRFASPTDYNCMGYAVPAVIGSKLANPGRRVVGIIGDGAFLMTCMEIVTAAELGLGAVFTVFSDGELSQISQAQSLPYHHKTCTILPEVRLRGIAEATGAQYVSMGNNGDIESSLDQALSTADQGKPVVLDVAIDYSKKTRFTKGIIGTNLKRMPLETKARMIGRAAYRHVRSWVSES